MSDRANPFSDTLAVENSSYATYRDGALVHPLLDREPSTLMKFVHEELRALILNEHFSCLGGKAALRQGNYGFGLYADLASRAASAGVARDLYTFLHETDRCREDAFATYLACFAGPTSPDETSFERLLWAMLQSLHDADAVYHPWDPSVSDDPSDPDFSFSFAGVAFFVIGLHAASSRAARRFAWPTLVFNPHRQFVALRDRGRFTRFQQVIRSAEEALQGDLNPMLADFGTRSEAPQYSGRVVGTDWQCPFRSRRRHDTD